MPGRAVPMVHMGTPPDGPEPRHARWGTAALAQFGISVLVAGYTYLARPETWVADLIALGLVPVVAATLGMLVPALFLQWVVEQSWAQPYSISYVKGKQRTELAKQDQAKVPLFEQLAWSLYVTCGPPGILNGAVAALLLPFALTTPTSWTDLTPDSLGDALAQFVLLELIGDFWLYWGHRIQHDSQYLWKHYHSFHHSIGTPTPFSTIYIDPIDAALQAAIPIMLAALMVRPDVGILYIYIFLRVGENVVNHSGLEHPVLNFLTLKFLPGRASVNHHDYHHKYSNYSTNAKNYAEGFIFWDWAFGTLSKKSKQAQ